MTTLKTQTPWGTADEATEYGPGVTFYSTPSHGGFFVKDQILLNRIPKHHRAFAAQWSKGWGDRWFEEDCAAYAVVAALPELFPADEVERAQKGVAWIERTA